MILITGITGFVGRNLASFLIKNNFDFKGVSRIKTNKNILLDELSDNIWNKSNICIHLAGNNHHVNKGIPENEYFEVNTELTKNIFDQFLKSNCETFIYMSSVKAVADKVSGFLTEEKAPNPSTAYGKSKLAAEQYILSKKIPHGKRVYILRPCMIHGPNNKGNLNLLYNFVSRGIPYPLGKYQNERSFVSVQNVCFVIKELIEKKNIQSGIYNIADNDTLSTRELVEIIGSIINKPIRLINIPKFLIKIVAKLGDLVPLPINSERVEKLTENYRVSNEKIIKAIGKQLPLSAKRGIEKTIESFLISVEPITKNDIYILPTKK